MLVNKCHKKKDSILTIKQHNKNKNFVNDGDIFLPAVTSQPLHGKCHCDSRERIDGNYLFKLL